jgi:probable phosphoglycerate mutase
MQGHAPVPLNETGRSQADRVGRYLAAEYDIDAVASSDLLRTRETAEHILHYLDDVPTGFDRVWRERDLGVYQGLSHGDIHERFPEFALGEASVKAADQVPESGESLLELRDRVLTGWETLLGRADGTVLVVTHGGPIYMLLGHVKELDVQTALLEHSQSNCGVNEFQYDGHKTRLCRENVTEWADDGATDIGGTNADEWASE